MRSGIPVVDVNAKLGTMTDPPDTPEIQHIKDAFRYPGFRPLARVRRHPSIPDGRVVTLVRRGKKDGLRLLRQGVPNLVRQSASACSRPGLRALADLA